MGRAGLAIAPPESEDELRERAAWLAGRTVGELAAALGVAVPPVGARGKGKVLADADRAEWETSVACAKLRHVLFVPIVVAPDDSALDRRIGTPLFWRPTRRQETILRADFEDAMGIIGAGGIEALTARSGRWLQVRPKAATGSVRTISFGPEGEWIATVPRGFYLRATFTRALLADPTATPP